MKRASAFVGPARVFDIPGKLRKPFQAAVPHVPVTREPAIQRLQWGGLDMYNAHAPLFFRAHKAAGFEHFECFKKVGKAMS